MITRRGWALVGAATGLFVAGRILGLVELAVLAVAAVLTLLAAMAWVRIRAPHVIARRELRDDAAERPVHGHLRMQRVGEQPALGVVERDSGFVAGSLDAQHAHAAHYTGACQRCRGAAILIDYRN